MCLVGVGELCAFCACVRRPWRSSSRTGISEAPSGPGASVVFFPRYFLYLKAIDFFLCHPCILLISFVLPFYNKLFISVPPFLNPYPAWFPYLELSFKCVTASFISHLSPPLSSCRVILLPPS